MGKRFHVHAGDLDFFLDDAPSIKLPVVDAPKLIEGPQGPVGPKGRDGKDGIDGAHGKDGRPGKDGKDGRQGPQGNRGPKGDAGQNGKDGKDGQQGLPGENGKDGQQGLEGDNGWTPIPALERRGDAVLMRVIDWFGGEGDKPATGYVGVEGITNDPLRAVNLRGPSGPAGSSMTGGGGGLPGYAGWSPLLAIEVDGDRRVFKIADWFGGEGDKPAVGQYIGPDGLVDDIADGQDVASGGGGGSDGDAFTTALIVKD